ncbi:hypothetical protein JQV64_09130 [Sulfitobacter geojensis]|uniref:hypothetical protein n=1 Tax=Sulfitobacter geojensis TaxID=1342299 RepID=UPI00193A8DBC|nr:hypothetical protein [Sulfitobacter geojensis]MBM1790970.1 hypothetical protein [Sulfitobacter geojensis]MBM1827952.1 hypothetical protein [Sulfitobacter geojensis]
MSSCDKQPKRISNLCLACLRTFQANFVPASAWMSLLMPMVHRSFGWSRPAFAAKIHLQMHNFWAASNSCNIAENYSLMWFPAAMARYVFERLETSDADPIVMTGLCSDKVSEVVDTAAVLSVERETACSAAPIPVDYTLPNNSERVLQLILGAPQLSDVWKGLRQNSQSWGVGRVCF